MNDNLSDMVAQTEVSQTTGPIDFDEIQETVIETQEEVIKEEVEKEADPDNCDVSVITLFDWFEANHKLFENVNYVKTAGVRGVDPSETLICAVAEKSGNKNEDGDVIRHFRFFEGANLHPVLNAPAAFMDMFSNGFVIGYSFDQNLFIKCYGVRTGLVVIYCAVLDEILIPFNKVKMKKKDMGLNLIYPDIESITSYLNQPLDREALQIQYRQIQKHIDNIETKTDVIKWLTAKAYEVTDINHLLQIDDVIMWMVS